MLEPGRICPVPKSCHISLRTFSWNEAVRSSRYGARYQYSSPRLLAEMCIRDRVSYEQFYEELINSCCGANLLTYIGRVNLKELYEAGFSLEEVVIPKGNRDSLSLPISALLLSAVPFQAGFRRHMVN